jgi:hypothetical protein
MNSSIRFKTTSLPFLVSLALACFGLLPAARAVNPPPDGGYAGYNTAEGDRALLNLTSGDSNTAIGDSALFRNTTGRANTAAGSFALYLNTTGSGNIAVGINSGFNITGDDNIIIGNFGLEGESRTIRIGVQRSQTKTFIAGISGTPIVGGVGVRVNASGQLGTAPSSVRFKQDIRSMGDASDAVFALRPVTFRYKQQVDPEGSPQFGLVAEEVEKVDPNLIVRDADGRPYSVRYDAVNAMLLNEFLKEHRKNEEQEATIGQLKKELQTNAAHHQKQIDALSAALQKVSAQLALSKAAPQPVLDDQ